VIYRRLQDHHQTQRETTPVDLLLCCGDFQSHRNPADFHSSSIPPKYRTLGTFASYYSGEKKAPILTIFIGGNHEASQPLRELCHGGWVAPNIYYLGAAGVVRFAGLRIGGLSGIFKGHDYAWGHFERVPYDRSSLRSVYHVRNVDVLRMKCLSVGKDRNGRAHDDDQTKDFHRPVDIVLSHDWPLGIEQHGNTNDLLRRKPYFRQEVADNNLGSPPNREVLDLVRPKHWFSAHLHVKFKATVRFPAIANAQNATTHSSHDDDFMSLIPSQVIDRSPSGGKEPSDEAAATNTDAAVDKDVIAESPKTEFHGLESSKCTTGGDSSVGDLTEQMTRFLALDKCLPRRQFLSILNVEVPQAKSDDNARQPPDSEASSSSSPYRLEYDPEWLAILRKTHRMTCTERRRVDVPQNPTEVISAEELAAETEWVISRLKERASQRSDDLDDSSTSYLTIPPDFVPTVPFASDPVFQGRGMCRPLPMMGNPITDNLLELLELEHILTQPYDPTLTIEKLSSMLQGGKAPTSFDSNEIEIGMDDDDGGPPPAATRDSNEIDIDGNDDDEIDIDDIDNDETDDNESNKKARLEGDPE
jgi:lariat debranching enzyme